MARSKIVIQRVTSSDGQAIVGAKGMVNISSDSSDQAGTISQQQEVTVQSSSNGSYSYSTVSYSASTSQPEEK